MWSNHVCLASTFYCVLYFLFMLNILSLFLVFCEVNGNSELHDAGWDGKQTSVHICHVGKASKNLLLKCLFSSKSQRDPGVLKLKLSWQRKERVIKILQMVSELTGLLAELSLKMQPDWLHFPSSHEFNLNPSVIHSTHVSHSSILWSYLMKWYRGIQHQVFLYDCTNIESKQWLRG